MEEGKVVGRKTGMVKYYGRRIGLGRGWFNSGEDKKEKRGEMRGSKRIRRRKDGSGRKR